MNHDRLTLYYRSTISHFLLDLLNPTGPSNHLAAPEEGWLRLNKDQAEPVQCWDLGSKITDNTHAKQVHNTPFVPCFIDKVHCTTAMNLEVK